MANDFIRIGTEGTGKLMDAESFIRGAATTIYRERIEIGGTSDTDIVLPTSAAPAAAAFGLPVRVAESAQVSGTVQVSGAVQVSGSVTVLGTALVSVVPGVSVTVQQGVSVSAVVSGTVSVIAPGSTTGSSGMSGLLVWLGVGQTIATVQTIGTVLGTVAISGTVSVSNGTTSILLVGTTAVPSVSATGGIVWIAGGQSTTAFPVVVTGTVTAGTTVVSLTGSALVSGTVTVNGTVAISGTGLVSVVPGLSVSAVVSGTVTALLDRTTAVPSASATGVVVWVGGGQSTTAFPVVVTGTVTAGAGTTVISGTVTNIPLYSTTATPAAAATGEIVWVANPGAAVATTVLTVQTILGTAVVSVVPGLSVTIQQGASVSAVVSGTVSVVQVDRTTAVPSASATGLVVWVGGGQSTTAFPVVVTGTVTAGAGTTVVSLTGSALVSGTVTVIAPGSTTGSSGMSGLLVWLGASQSVLIGGQSVTIQQGASVTVQAGVSVTVVTQLGTQVVSVVPGVSVQLVTVQTVLTVVTLLGTVLESMALALFTTGVATVASTGQIVVPKDVGRDPVVIDISSTVVGSSTTMLMTVYTGATLATTGASFWVVPAGKVFRVMNMNIIAVSSAVLGQAQLVVLVGTAAASVSVVATVGIVAVLPFAIQASTAPFALGAYLADVVGGTTVGVGIKGGTSCSVLGAVISGYLF